MNSNIKNLNELLNNEQEENRFNELANYLINECVLVAGDTKIELVEIEFYYKSNVHDDCNTHGHDIQRKTNQWYIHQNKNNKSYKSGYRKGLDITFGDNDCYGGILIRGIKVNGKYIAGPSKCVDKIIEILTIDKRDKNVMNSFSDAINDGKLTIKEVKKDKKILFRSPRYGLVKFDKYYAYPYRYISYDQGYRKETNFKDKVLADYYSLALGVDSKEIKEFANLINLDLEGFIDKLDTQIKKSEAIKKYLEKINN